MFAQVMRSAVVAGVVVCKTVGLSGGRCPHTPGPPFGDGGSERVISSPGQTEPYPGTPGAARARFDRPCGQTLAAPENPG
jgi:hypothetical protein